MQAPLPERKLSVMEGRMNLWRFNVAYRAIVMYAFGGDGTPPTVITTA